MCRRVAGGGGGVVGCPVDRRTGGGGGGGGGETVQQLLLPCRKHTKSAIHKASLARVGGRMADGEWAGGGGQCGVGGWWVGETCYCRVTKRLDSSMFF